MEWGKAPSVSPESRSTDGGAHSHKPILTLSRVSNNIHVGEVCRAAHVDFHSLRTTIYRFFFFFCLFVLVSVWLLALAKKMCTANIKIFFDTDPNYFVNICHCSLSQLKLTKMSPLFKTWDSVNARTKLIIIIMNKLKTVTTIKNKVNLTSFTMTMYVISNSKLF